MKSSTKGTRTALEKLEIFINTLNHACVAITTFYSTWYCINYGFDQKHTLHVLLTSLGYHLLLAEGIMSMYDGNSFTMFMKRSQKTFIHWFLQATGGTLGLIGFFLEVVQRAQAGKSLFHIWHARFGLVSAIFLMLAMLSGCSSLFSGKLKSFLRPIFSKFFHNVFAIFAFIFGIIAMIISYNTRSFAKNIDPGNMRYAMIGFLSCILLFTLIGPLKTLFRHFGIMFSSNSKGSDERIENGSAT